VRSPLTYVLSVDNEAVVRFSACIASAFGLYYRVKLGRNSDVTWKLIFVLLWVYGRLAPQQMARY